MIIIEKFLGKRLEIPEDRRFYTRQGLWAKQDKNHIAFGLTEPALILSGGFKGLDWLVTEDQMVEQGATVVFAITGKILYIDTPIKGNIHFNSEIKQLPELVMNDPYNLGWLFKIEPAEEIGGSYQQLSEASAYVESLKSSEGLKNPDGLKGGVSGMCKAVYSGIGEQKV
ncbi:MAG: hypothetical protein LJE96_08210 [Deltaproteobacteria bacterium]|jgi:glycine cleavage system H lipoate-binding protein|nr:hypothetical protein [Deltaproteobacteria bacterium]